MPEMSAAELAVYLRRIRLTHTVADLQALAQEVAPFGIRVAIVEPGVTKSAIFAKNVDAPNQSGAYDAHYRRLFQFYAAGYTNATDPLEVYTFKMPVAAICICLNT